MPKFTNITNSATGTKIVYEYKSLELNGVDSKKFNITIDYLRIYDKNFTEFQARLTELITDYQE
jgi:hypothetical protein